MANAFCCNALIFRTLQAIRETKYNIPYLYLHLPCSAAAVEGVSSFKKENYLTSTCQIKEILNIIAMLYV